MIPSCILLFSLSCPPVAAAFAALRPEAYALNIERYGNHFFYCFKIREEDGIKKYCALLGPFVEKK